MRKDGNGRGLIYSELLFFQFFLLYPAGIVNKNVLKSDAHGGNEIENVTMKEVLQI